MSVDFGNLELTKLLLSHGADPNHRYDIGDIPLEVTAAARGYPKTLRALIAAGADVNAQCKDGISALDGAMRYNKTACEKCAAPRAGKATRASA